MYVVDVYTEDQIDDESLHGLNGRLCRGNHVLADNLILAVVPLRNDAGVSAFRIRLHALERIHAPGEVGRSDLQTFRDLGHDKDDWIDVPNGDRVCSDLRPADKFNTRPSTRDRGVRHPTPPPFLVVNGILYADYEGRADVNEDPPSSETASAVFDSAIEFEDGNTLECTIDEPIASHLSPEDTRSYPRLEATEELDIGAYRFSAPTSNADSAHFPLGECTRMLSRQEIALLHRAPLVPSTPHAAPSS